MDHGELREGGPVMRCEWEDSGPDYDGTTIGFPCGAEATTLLIVADPQGSGPAPAGMRGVAYTAVLGCADHQGRMVSDQWTEVVTRQPIGDVVARVPVAAACSCWDTDPDGYPTGPHCGKLADVVVFREHDTEHPDEGFTLVLSSEHVTDRDRVLTRLAHPMAAR